MSENTAAEHYEKALQLQKEGKLNEAISEMGLAISGGMTDVDTQYLFAQLLIAASLYDEAIPALRKVTGLSSWHTYAHNDLAVIFQTKGLYDEAIESYRQAVSWDYGNVNAVVNLLRLLVGTEKRDEAVALVRTVMSRRPLTGELEAVVKELDLAIAVRSDREDGRHGVSWMSGTDITSGTRMGIADGGVAEDQEERTLRGPMVFGGTERPDHGSSLTGETSPQYFVHKTAQLEKADLIKIGRNAEIKDYVIIRTYTSPVEIGEFTQLNPFTVIYGYNGVYIGNNVMIAPHCMIAAGNHDYKQTETPMRFAGGLTKGPIVIEDDVWIGANCSITDGVRIGKGAVVAANSVVIQNVAPYDIVSGVPAKTINNRLAMKDNTSPRPTKGTGDALTHDGWGTSLPPERRDVSIAEIQDFNQRARDKWVQEKAVAIPEGSTVLDLGAGTCPYRPLFGHCNYKSHDFKKYTGSKLGGTTQYGEIDFESDITDVPVPDNSFDVVLCTEVLEHVPEPIKALEEMARITKPGGRLLITAPLGAGLHQLPYHYYGGYTPEWYRHFLPRFGFDVIEIVPNGGFFKLLAQESARVTWLLPKEHPLLEGRGEAIHKLFGESIPRFLFDLDGKMAVEQFTVGYHVEAVKRGGPKTERKTEEDMPAYAEGEGTKGSTRERKAGTIGIVFSKDRAMQLECTLRSLMLHCKDPGEMDLNVLYAASLPLYERQYGELKKEFPSVRFTRERSFREDLLALLSSHRHVFFLVDDNIFVRYFALKGAIKALDANRDALCFSFRLGKNTTYCYMLNREQALPSHKQLSGGVMKYDWTTSELDFGYPLEVSSSVYRVRDIIGLMRLDYRNPNTLELMLDQNKQLFKDKKRSLLCFDQGVTFCNPVNMVQTMWINRAGGKGDYSAGKLAEMFDAGFRIDVKAYSGFIPNACHQEVELKFVKGKEEKAPLGANERPLVSIMIISYNGINHIRACIESIERNTPEEHEIVVVDNARNDGSLDYVKSVPGITVVENPTNIGYSPARAQAMAVVRGEYIVSLDDDTVVTKGWVRRFIEHAKNHPELGIIGPRSNYVSGPQLIPNVSYQNIEEMEAFASNWSQANQGGMTRVNKLIGFCMFIPRKVLNKIGCIDYNFGTFFGFDDDDYSLRAQVAGFKLAIADDIFIHHTGGPQGKGDAAYNKSLIGAWEIFKKKWDLPSQLPYGQSYNVSQILERPFDKKKHYVSTPDMGEIEELIHRGGKQRSEPGEGMRDMAAAEERINEAFASAKRAVNDGDWDDAVNRFEALTRDYPDLGIVYAGLGSALLNKKEYPQAIAVLAKAIELLPGEVEIWSQLATAFMLSGETKEAMVALRRALAIEPDNREFLLAAADISRSEKDYNQAIEHVSRAITLDPEDVESISLLGLVSIEIGDGEASRVILEKLKRVSPHDPVITELEQAIERQAFDRDAEKVMDPEPSEEREMDDSKNGTRTDSGRNPAQKDLLDQAVAAHGQGDTKAAIKLFEGILTLDKDSAEDHNDIGVLYFQDGNMEKAITHLREAVKLDPMNVDYERNIADVCLEAGNVEEAAEYYGNILRRQPNNVEVMVIAAQLCSRAGLEDDAQIYLARVREIEPDNEFARENMAG